MKNLKEAIKRLGFTVSKQNKPNATDAEALNTIIEFINQSTVKKVDDNRLFAKLLCYYISKQYDVNNDINGTIYLLNDYLKRPLDFHLELLACKIKHTQFINFAKTLKIDVTNVEFESIDELIKKESEFWDVHSKSIAEYIRLENSNDVVKDKFYLTANEILNKPKYRN